MPVFNYNVENRLKKYTVLTPANRCFNENMPTKDSPRPAWAQMMLFVQKENIQNRNRLDPQPIIIKIRSMAAMQCRSEAQFQHLISEAVRHGASVYSVAEDALFNKNYPQGITNQPEKFAKAKALWQKQTPKFKPAEKSNRIIRI